MPNSDSAAQTVAVFNSSEDVVELFRILLEREGFNTAAAHVPDIERGNVDVIEFMARHDPKVIIYDLSPPYLQTWTFAKLLMTSEAFKDRKLIFTTTNKTQLEKVAGSLSAYELAQKPFDFEEVVKLVKQALAGEGN